VDANPLVRRDVFGLDTYMCRQPLHACGYNGTTRCFVDVPGNPFFHQWLCVVEQNGNLTCGGQDRAGNPFSSPGKPSNDSYPFNRPDFCQRQDDRECFDSCVKRKLLDPTRPRYGIPFGVDCQEWSDDVVTQCKRECSGR